jgi:predicted transposase/invertase (TIGR01784 family)
MAAETMVGFTKEQIEWFRNESKLKYELDRRAMIAEARDEARDEFLEEGRKEGLAIGETRGIAIGEAREAEKNREEKLRAARNLKQLGLSEEQIASALDLRAEDLKAL